MPTKNRHPQRNVFTFLLDQVALTTPGELFLAWLLTTAGFAVLYFMLSFVPGHGPTVLHEGSNVFTRLGNSLYFSIVTATSVGYGDIVPQGFSKTLVSLQSIVALLLFAAFVTKIASHRESLALEEVRTFTLEESLHRILADLFITRKDFDRIIATAKAEKHLLEDQWEDLQIAYRRCQSLLQSIPELYGSDDDPLTLDPKREELLVAAAARTLTRINTLLDALSHEGIDWLNNQQSRADLEELLQVVGHTVSLWGKCSPSVNLEDITEMQRTIRTKSTRRKL